MAGLISILLLTFTSKTSINVPVLVIILFPVAAVVYSAGYLFFFKGFEIGNVSIIAATMNLWAVFTMLFAFMFMEQRLSATQTLGVLMIILGATSASINWSEIRNQKFQLSAGVKEAVLGAFFFGVFLWSMSLAQQTAPNKTSRAITGIMHPTLGSLAPSQAFFWLRFFPAPEQNPRPPLASNASR